MATVTISAEDLQFVYSQLNFLRNYVGVWSLDWQEHVVVAAPVPAPAPAPVPAPVPATGTAAPVPATGTAAPVVATPVVTEVPETVLSAPIKRGFF
jgi:hypothetical protein